MKKINKAGFTFLETIIYIGLFSFIMTALFGLVWLIMPQLQYHEETSYLQRDILHAMNTVELLINSDENGSFYVVGGELVADFDGEQSQLISKDAKIQSFDITPVSQNEKYELLEASISTAEQNYKYPIKKYED